MRPAIMSTALYAQPATVNVFERGRRSGRARWRIRCRPALGHHVSPCRKHRRDLLQRCPAFATGRHRGILHVLPKGKPLGTKQRFQTIFGLIFIDGHTSSFILRSLKHRHPADQGPDDRTAKSPPGKRAVSPLRPKPFRINRPFHPWIDQHHISLRTGGQRPAR